MSCNFDGSTLYIPLFRTVDDQRTFYYRIASLWNVLPQNVKLRQSSVQYMTTMGKRLNGKPTEFQHTARLNTKMETVQL